MNEFETYVIENDAPLFEFISNYIASCYGNRFEKTFAKDINGLCERAGFGELDDDSSKAQTLHFRIDDHRGKFRVVVRATFRFVADVEVSVKRRDGKQLASSELAQYFKLTGARMASDFVEL